MWLQMEKLKSLGVYRTSGKSSKTSKELAGAQCKHRPADNVLQLEWLPGMKELRGVYGGGMPEDA